MARAPRKISDNNPMFGDDVFFPTAREFPELEKITIIPIGVSGLYTDGNKVYKLLESDLADLLGVATTKIKEVTDTNKDGW